MHKSIDPSRSVRSRRAPLLVAAAITSAALFAGCGGSSGGQTALTAGGETGPALTRANATTTAGSRHARSGNTVGAAGGSTGRPKRPAAFTGGRPGALAFAKCMRANGVSEFPDPGPGGGFAFHMSASLISSPAFKAARARCARLMPSPLGPGGQNASPQQVAQALAQLRTVAQCMRAHGVPDFPDPRATRPPDLSPGEYGEITDYEGAWLLFPATINMQSPAWSHAAAACGPLAESFNHPHH
ncbi:MAG: hypothetical protein ACYCXW_13995 [Solirubrobacteraceae bacterium]